MGDKPFKTFLIDAVKCEVREIELDGTLENYYREMDCSMIQAVYSQKEGVPDLYVDEEGLWNKKGLYFIYAGYPQPLVGSAIAIATDDEGYTIAPDTTLLQMQAAVKFVSLANFAGRIVAIEREPEEQEG